MQAQRTYRLIIAALVFASIGHCAFAALFYHRRRSREHDIPMRVLVNLELSPDPRESRNQACLARGVRNCTSRQELFASADPDLLCHLKRRDDARTRGAADACGQHGDLVQSRRVPIDAVRSDLWSSAESTEPVSDRTRAVLTWSWKFVAAAELRVRCRSHPRQAHHLSGVHIHRNRTTLPQQACPLIRVAGSGS